MFRAYGPGPSLWESLLPEEVLALPEELARVDELLDDPVFFEPVRPYFDPRMGRKSVPMVLWTRRRAVVDVAEAAGGIRERQLLSILLLTSPPA